MNDEVWPTPIPSNPHLVLDADAVKGRILVVGDVHGCLEELKELLSLCKYDEMQCTLIFVGDLVNKAPYSAEVVQFVRSLRNAYCVRGNHDDTALSHILGTNKKPTDESYSYIQKFSKYNFCICFLMRIFV